LITLGEHVAIVFNEDFRKDSNLLEFKVDNLGAIQPNRMLGMGTDNVLIFPDGFRQVTARTVLVPGVKRKRKGFLQITY
jgi:hypothetical protein